MNKLIILVRMAVKGQNFTDLSHEERVNAIITWKNRNKISRLKSITVNFLINGCKVVKSCIDKKV